MVHVTRTIDRRKAEQTVYPDATDRIIADFGAAMGELRCIGSERLVKAGVSMTQLHVLSMLERHGEMTMSRLAGSLDVSLSNVDRAHRPDGGARLRRAGPRPRRPARRHRPRHPRRARRCSTRSRRCAPTCSAASSTASRRSPRRPPAWRPPICAPRSRPMPPTRASASTTMRHGVDRRVGAATQPTTDRKDLTPHGSFPTSAESPSLAEDPALGLSHRAKLEILFAILLGLFLGALDQTIVGTALPTIVTELGGNELYIWVVTIYLLTSHDHRPVLRQAVRPLRPQAAADDRHRRSSCIGSALSGLSQNMEQLILFRGIQGIGAGALFPISLAVIGDLFTPAERGKYQGLFGAVFGLARHPRPGPRRLAHRDLQLALDLLRQHPDRHRQPDRHLAAPADGQATGRHPQPRLPRCRRVHGRHQLPAHRPDQQGHDPATGRLHEWTDPDVGGLILIGIALSLVFLFIESRAKEPIVPLDLWRNRTYAASILSTFLISFGFFGAIVFLPRWFQFVAGASATESGLPDAAAPRRPDPVVHRRRHPRVADRPLQGDHPERPRADGRRPVADDQPDRHDAAAGPVGLDVHHRPGHRPDAVGVHDRRPERRAVPAARRGHEQPDVLPPDRRVGRPGHRGHGLRHDPDRGAARAG